MAQGLESGYIQLGAQRVEVRIVRDLCEKENAFGDANTRKNVIRVAGDVALTQAVDALWHEICHFLLRQAGVSLSDKDEESVASALGSGITSLFRDNPKWVESILKIFREEAKCQLKSTRKRKQTGTQARKPQRSHRATHRT